MKFARRNESCHIHNPCADFFRRSMFLEPEVAFNRTAAILNKNEDLRSLLGGQLKYGRLKAYTSTAAGFNHLTMRWKPASVQILFTAEGPKGSAVVTAICSKGFMKETVEYIAVDLQEGLSSKLVIKGDAKELTINGDLKKFLSYQHRRGLE